MLICTTYQVQYPNWKDILIVGYVFITKQYHQMFKYLVSLWDVTVSTSIWLVVHSNNCNPLVLCKCTVHHVWSHFSSTIQVIVGTFCWLVMGQCLLFITIGKVNMWFVADWDVVVVLILYLKSQFQSTEAAMYCFYLLWLWHTM